MTIARYFIHVKEVGGASVSGMLLSSSKKGNSLAQVPEEKIPNSVVSGRACSELSEVSAILLSVSLPFLLQWKGGGGAPPGTVMGAGSSRGYVPHAQVQKECSQDGVTPSGLT